MVPAAEDDPPNEGVGEEVFIRFGCPEFKSSKADLGLLRLCIPDVDEASDALESTRCIPKPLAPVLGFGSALNNELK